METSKVIRVLSILKSTLGITLELGAAVVLTLTFGPPLVTLWLLNVLVRSIISLIFKCTASSNQRLQLVSQGADGIWSFQKPGNSRNIIILYVYNSPLCLDTFRRNYVQRVINHQDSTGRPYAKLTKIFTKKFGYNCWASCDFDIDNHIRLIEDREGILSESEVLTYMSSLVGDMPEDKPQWEEILVPRFEYDQDLISNSGHQRSARIYRSHHAYMDGCSTLLMAGTCMNDSTTKFPYVLDPTSELKVLPWKQVLFKVSCVILSLTTVVKTIYGASRIRSRFLMNRYSGKQTFAWSPPLDLKTIRIIKDQTNVSVPTILSSVIIGALTSVQEKYTGLKLDSLTMGLVGAILPYPDISPRNRFTVVNFTTTKLSSDRISRLGSVAREIRTLTQGPEGLVAYFVFQIFGKFPAFMVQILMGSAKTPLIYSNVPWASERVKLWGQEVIDVAGWMPLFTFAGIGLLSVTYGEKVRLCVISDEDCLNQEEIEFLIEQVQQEIQLLYGDCLENFTQKICAV